MSAPTNLAQFKRSLASGDRYSLADSSVSWIAVHVGSSAVPTSVRSHDVDWQYENLARHTVSFGKASDWQFLDGLACRTFPKGGGGHITYRWEGSSQ